MTVRRSRGDGGLFWSESRLRWVAELTIGYDGRGKRVVRRASCRTKTEAKTKLRELQRDLDDGLPIANTSYTVADAVDDWLSNGLVNRSEATNATLRHLCGQHVVPLLGARKLRDLSTSDVERWLAGLSGQLSTRTLQGVRSCLNRAVRRAMAQDRVKRNVVELTTVPTGTAGRPSKALTPPQIDAVLNLTRSDRLHSYVVLSVLTGARTEELRALLWDHVHLDTTMINGITIPPHLEVWRSVRAKGETKTPKSRRTLALPALCVEALRRQRALQNRERIAAGRLWQDTGLVFVSEVGTALDAANVRRGFRRALRLVPGIDPAEWTPRELRHSFVSLLADAGLSPEDIAPLVGHRSTAVTELVYRHQVRPVLQRGALVIDQLMGDRITASDDRQSPG